MRKTIAGTLLFWLAHTGLLAQPIPCGTDPGMTSFCDEACIICDINGFTGINDDPETGQAPPGFCTSTVHHMQWIGFIAGSTNLTLNVKVFGCQTGYGLEIGIYQSLDCENFQLVSNCDGDVLNNETGVFYNTVPLTIGQYYYFVMDGNHDDVCQYTVTVVNGTTAVNALPNSGVLSGDFTVCPGRTEQYSLSAPQGATWFSWSLDGKPVSSGVDTSLTLDWTTPGLHQLCATASNVCDTAPPACQIVQVLPVPVTTIQKELCAGECWQGADTTLCTPGFYTFHLAGQENCDSIVNVDIKVLPSSQTDLDLMICKGDTIRVGNVPYFASGQFQEILSNQFGCDSTVNLDLQVIVCEIKGLLTPEAVDCNGKPTGALRFQVKDGTPPFTYTWERLGDAQTKGSGSLGAVNSELVLPNLPKGTYFVTITDNFGHDLVLFGDIKEPLPLDLSMQVTDHHGYGISCAEGQDGQIGALASGGKGPYTYQWSTGATTAGVSGLGAGAYSCTLTDVNGCSAVFSANLTEPPVLAFAASFTQPGCAGLNSGAASVTSTGGGVPPYSFSLSGSGFSAATTYADLLYGKYTLRVQDANGCTADSSATLLKPLIPEIVLSPDVTVELAESTPLYLLANVPLDSILWQPALGLSCTTCPKPEATPYHTTTYTATVFSAVNGCKEVDSLTVFVLDRRDVYIPNSFSPNDDGENDHFLVFGGPEVQQVASLQVWSRWGELVFEANDQAANQESAGWDGSFNSKELPPGVFTWRAVVEFVDGFRQTYTGDVTLVR